MPTSAGFVQLPALAGEQGVIVGHRRMKVAEELGIEPVIERIDLGDGDEVPAKRICLAIRREP
jgi:hypothetical protein